VTAPTNNASFYANFAELNSLKREAKTQSQESVRKAAQQFEAMFMQMMLKSMREASPGDSMTGSNDMDFYQGMFDQQLATQLSKGKGLGLADMLVEQLTRSGLVKGGAAAEEGAMNRAPTDTTVGAQFTGAERSRSIAPSSSVKDTTSSTWPPATRDDFIRQLWPHAEKAGQKLGVDPATLVAHAALETGWGKNIPSDAGGSSFNLFGIKANSRWNGDTVDRRTQEFDNGVASNRVERFKSYDSPAQCFDDYAALLGGADRYAGARNTGNDAASFAQALQRGGYATDPEYASKLSAVANNLNALLGRNSSSSFTAGGRYNAGVIS
jgi:flagellar protein FlgJ